METALIGFAILLGLVFLRVPIGVAMGVVGFGGYWYVTNFNASLSQAAIQVTEAANNYGLSVVPLFILMGNLVTKAGLSRELYAAANAMLGHRRGGLSMATIVACGGFSAICGSSLATAATMSKVAMPSMRKYGYADSLATASIAAGGTLGILIPPSVILVIYGLMTQSSIGQLFAAGFLPGLLGVLLYLCAVQWVVIRKPHLGPRGEKRPWRERVSAMLDVWGTLLLFVTVIGGIYGGAFTPTEAAGIGAAGAFVIAVFGGAFTEAAPRGIGPYFVYLGRKLRGRSAEGELAEGNKFAREMIRGNFDRKSLYDALVDSAQTTAVLFFVLIGALMFSNFVNIAGLPQGLLSIVDDLGVSPYVVILVILGIYIMLGCVFESLSMLLLTVPIFYPVVRDLPLEGLTPDQITIWFGIIAVVVTEISLITPPVGLNVFVLSGVLPDVKTTTIFRGVTPFWVADIVRLMILTFIPGVSLYLPTLFFT